MRFLTVSTPTPTVSQLALTLTAVVCLSLQSCGSTSGRSIQDTGMRGEPEQIRSDMDAASHIRVRTIRTFTKKEQRARQRPSEIDGLTQGQLDDMPIVGALPPLFGLEQTQQQLDTHAMIVAREDVASGVVYELTVEQRFLFIQNVWTSEWTQRRTVLNGVQDTHQANAQRMRLDVGRNAAWQRLNDDRQQEHQHVMDRIMREELPVLTPEEAHLLRSL